jgi:hypothetical protein
MSSKLDDFAPREAQDAWLASSAFEAFTPLSAARRADDDPNDPLRLLFSTPDWPRFGGIFRFYIQNEIFMPLTTAGRWWGVSTPHYGSERGLVRIHIGGQEALTLSCDPPGSFSRISGRVCVGGSVEKARHELLISLGGSEDNSNWIEVAKSVLKREPQPQSWIFLKQATLDQVERLLSLHKEALKRFNIEIMRRSLLIWPQYHNSRLLGVILPEYAAQCAETA